MTVPPRITRAGRIAALAALAWLSAWAPSLASAWVAFIAPDFQQTRALHAELQKKAGSEPALRGVEIRFVAVPHTTDRAQLRPPIAEALAHAPHAVVAAADSVAFVAMEITTTIPILFATAYDPVRTGLAQSLARPGRNLTGFTSFSEIEAKQLELLRELVPKAALVGILDDGAWFGTRFTREHLEQFERSSGLQLRVFTGSTPEDMPRLVRSAEGRRVDAWLVPIHNLTGLSRDELVRAVHEMRKPAVYGRSFFVERGGLASYQEVLDPPTTIWRDMLALVLAGFPAGEIPVRRAREFSLAINLDEARHLGLTPSRSVLRRANKVVSAADTGQAHKP